LSYRHNSLSDFIIGGERVLLIKGDACTLSFDVNTVY
jgi:hypothetical protein